MELVGDFFTILITFAMEAAESEPYDPQGTPLCTLHDMHDPDTGPS